jgi:O-antigen/teichoic acid export membrane protein
MSIISFGCLSLIPFVGKFINWFLPQYTESVIIIYLITPIITSLSIIQVFIINFFKSVEKTMEYFKISIFVLIISFIGNLIAARVLRSINAITIASVISSYIWMIVANIYIQKCFSKKSNIYIYPTIMTLLYYLVYNIRIINNEFFMAFLYFIVYSIFSVFFFIRNKRMKYDEASS